MLYFEWIFYSCMILINSFSKMSQVILKIQGKQLTIFIGSGKNNGQDGKDYVHCALIGWF